MIWLFASTYYINMLFSSYSLITISLSSRKGIHGLSVRHFSIFPTVAEHFITVAQRYPAVAFSKKFKLVVGLHVSEERSKVC